MADRHDSEIFSGVRSFGHFSGASQKSASDAGEAPHLNEFIFSFRGFAPDPSFLDDQSR
jgi:hypothetical protein